MSRPNTTDEFIGALKTATDGVAARLQKALDNTGLNASQKAAFQAEIDRLTAMGTDPADPLAENL